MDCFDFPTSWIKVCWTWTFSEWFYSDAKKLSYTSLTNLGAKFPWRIHFESDSLWIEFTLNYSESNLHFYDSWIKNDSDIWLAVETAHLWHHCNVLDQQPIKCLNHFCFSCHTNADSIQNDSKWIRFKVNLIQNEFIIEI